MQSNQAGFDLRAFLDQQHSVGEVDSEGSFTILREKRQQKLAQFALEQDYDWVLKLVQAANRWGCKRLLVSQTRVATSFLFEPGTGELPRDHHIIEALEGDEDPRVVALSMALRALVAQVDLAFVMAIRHEGKIGQPIFAGADTEKLDHGTRVKWSSATTDGIRLTVSHFRSDEYTSGRFLPTITGVKRRDVSIADALKDSCFTSAVPIFLDGFCITEFAHDPILGATRYYRPFAKGVARPKRGFDTHIFPARAVSFLTELDHSLRGFHRFYIRCGEWWELRQFLHPDLDVGFVVPESSKRGKGQEDHRLFWTRDGVVVDTQRIPNRSFLTTIYLVCVADKLRSDLTGLQILVEEEGNRIAAAFLRKIAKELRKKRVQWIKETLAPEWENPTNTIAHANLEAGYSIFSESIGMLDHLSEFTKSLRRALRRSLIALEVKDKNLEPWHRTLGGDLNRVAHDLERFAKVRLGDS